MTADAWICRASAPLAEIRLGNRSGRPTIGDPLMKNIISACWGIFFVVWILAALFTKRTVYHESGAQRLRYMLPILIGWYLLFRGSRLPSPFSLHIIPDTDIIHVVAAILCVCGLAFCLWARAVLGRNWSGTV